MLHHQITVESMRKINKKLVITVKATIRRKEITIE